MKVMTLKSIEIQKAFESLNLTADAIQLIKDIVLNGYWGNADFWFGGETKVGDGYIINDADKGGHFSGKKISGIMSGIAKVISDSSCKFMGHEPDWWGDGTGDVLAFAKDFASYEELVEWAKSSEEKSTSKSEIQLPDINQSFRSHIIAKDRTAVKYVNKTQIQAEINLLLECITKAGANITLPQKEVKSKTDLMGLYGWLYQECVKYNESISSNGQTELYETPVEKTARPSAKRITNAEERFTQYSEELAKREAGEMFGLDAKGQKHRIASLKRKIARAERALVKIQKNS